MLSSFSSWILSNTCVIDNGMIEEVSVHDITHFWEADMAAAFSE